MTEISGEYRVEVRVMDPPRGFRGLLPPKIRQRGSEYLAVYGTGLSKEEAQGRVPDYVERWRLENKMNIKPNKVYFGRVVKGEGGK